MPLSPEDIVKNYIDDGSGLERVRHRTFKPPIAIVEPNPAWPQQFLDTKTRVQGALGSTAIGIFHVGSTSVPGLPAKDIIDVDLVVKDIQDEGAYVQPLESAGFAFLFRELWHQHRFFVDEGDRPEGYLVNLHVFGPDCPEVEKHRIFREWLVKTPDDLEVYAAIKRESAAAAQAAGETDALAYNQRKEKVLREILDRAYRDLGYIK